MFKHVVAVLIAVPVGVLGMLGCAQETGPDASEDVTEAQEAYGETACGTTSSYDYNDTNAYAPCYSAEHTLSSYASRSECPNSYIVKYTGINNSDVSAAAYPASTTDQSVCNYTHAYWKTYDASGNVVGNGSSHGVWISSGSYCGWALDTGKNFASVPAGGRVVATASHCIGSPCITVYEPVTVYARRNSCL